MFDALKSGNEQQIEQTKVKVTEADKASGVLRTEVKDLLKKRVPKQIPTIPIISSCHL
jgi:hypothetical protein